jgi:putative FmdB family regulatory protein
MPIYDYKCDDCGEELLDEFQHSYDVYAICSKCKKPMRRVLGLCKIDVFPADGITLTNVEAQPRTFMSKGEMVRYAREKNLELGALL